MRPDCQLQAFNAEVTDSFTIALSPCSHSCPPTLVPSFGNDGEGCCGWCIALSFHDTSLPRTWQSSTISPNSFGPSLVILGRFPPRPEPLGLIFEMGRGTPILWPHIYIYTYRFVITPSTFLSHSIHYLSTQKIIIPSSSLQFSSFVW